MENCCKRGKPLKRALQETKFDPEVKNKRKGDFFGSHSAVCAQFSTQNGQLSGKMTSKITNLAGRPRFWPENSLEMEKTFKNGKI